MLQTSIKGINELRREAIEELENKIKQSFERESIKSEKYHTNAKQQTTRNVKTTLCLNNMSSELEYEQLQDVDNIYIPLRFFVNKQLENQIQIITNRFNTYLLMPAISKENYEKINVQEIINKYNI